SISRAEPAARSSAPTCRSRHSPSPPAAPGSRTSNSGITWDEATFREYIKDPKAKVPGTKMTFPGLKDPKQIDDIVAYLKQFDATGKKAGIVPAGSKLAKVQ